MMAFSSGIAETATLGDASAQYRERSLTCDPARTGYDADLLLVRRCAERDCAALRLLLDRHQARLLAFLRRILDSPEDAEEAAQDVFLRVWQQAAGFQGRAEFATWMYRIAANVACDLLRRRKTQGRLAATLHDAPADDRTNPETQALARLDREEHARVLDHALRRLRADDRLLLVLYYAEELGYAEIQAVTGHSYTVLKVRLLRARKRLRGILESSGMGEAG